MKLYLAGPDVFRPDVLNWAATVRDICQRYGYEPLLPVDHNEDQPEAIFEANIELIRKAQVVVANLDPFRGAEPDAGTAFELGYAYALGKKVGGFVSRFDTVAQRVEAAMGPTRRTTEDRIVDRQGLAIEDFGCPAT